MHSKVRAFASGGFAGMSWYGSKGSRDFPRVALFLCLDALVRLHGWTGQDADDKSL